MKETTVLQLFSLGVYDFTVTNVLETTKLESAHKIALNNKKCFAYKVYKIRVADNGQRVGKPEVIKSVVIGKRYTREEIQKLVEEDPLDLRCQDILRFMSGKQLSNIVITRTGNYLVPEVGTVVFDHTKPPTS